LLLHLRQVYTPTGWPAVSTPVLRSLAGRPGAAKLALAELTGDTSADPGECMLPSVVQQLESSDCGGRR